MKLTAQNNRKVGRLTPRQAARRRMMPSKEAGQEGSKPVVRPSNSVVKFGKKSCVMHQGDRLLIEIHESDINDVTPLEIDKFISLYKSPLMRLPELTGNTADDIYKLIPAKRRMIHFALFMNNIQHYSGGRYYLVYLAYMLAEMGHKVTIISDKKAFFIKDFQYIDVADRIEWVVEERCRKSKWMLKAVDNDFDIVITSPLATAGFNYSMKFGIPCFAGVFETPNYVRKYRYGDDATEGYWSGYKRGIANHAHHLFSISHESINHAKEWFDDDTMTVKFKGKYDLIQPGINTWAADMVEAEEQNEVVFVGRHVDFKNPNEIIFAISKIDEEIRPVVNFVGSHSSKLRIKMQKNAETVGVKIRFYANITDEEKFYIIKRSKLMIFPSVFEGFGIPPAEALYCGKPAIVYDIPVLRGEYGDALEYVLINDENALAAKVEELLKDKEKRLRSGLNGRKALFKLDNPVPVLPSHVKKQLRKAFYGSADLSITAGMIVLNGADTIELSLKSVYDSVDKIVIVEGAVEDYAKNNPELIASQDRSKLNSSMYDSIDDTLSSILHFMDGIGDQYKQKIEIIHPPEGRFWKNKNEMQNAIAERVETDLYLKVDADEIFIEADVEYMKRFFMEDPDLTVIQILKHEFWKGFDMVACGGIWDRTQARMWRWNKDFRHSVDKKTGFNYYLDAAGKEVKAPNYKAMNLMEKLCYHLGYARDEDQIRGKINYYKNRGIEVGVSDNFSDWEQGMPTNSTHPQGTTAKPFVGYLPKILREGYFDVKKDMEVEERLENNNNILHSPVKKKENMGKEVERPQNH